MPGRRVTRSLLERSSGSKLFPISRQYLQFHWIRVPKYYRLLSNFSGSELDTLSTQQTAEPSNTPHEYFVYQYEDICDHLPPTRTSISHVTADRLSLTIHFAMEAVTANENAAHRCFWALLPNDSWREPNFFARTMAMLTTPAYTWKANSAPSYSFRIGCGVLGPGSSMYVCSSVYSLAPCCGF